MFSVTPLLTSILFAAFLGTMWRSCAGLLRTTESTRSRTSRRLLATISNDARVLAQEHASFLENIAKIDVPKRLPVFLETLKLHGMELVSPNNRKELNPFFIPAARNQTTGNYIGFLRWPTQKEEMELQVVSTNEAGIKLVALSIDKYVARMAAESDFYGREDASLLEALVNESEKLYTKGDSLMFLKSGRFPANTDSERRLLLDRYLLTKVGAFPEGYERVAEDFREKKNEVSALVTCERSSNVFYGWGHPNAYHAFMLSKFGRESEACDTARSSLAMPKWTLASSIEELDKIMTMSGFTDRKVVGNMHKIRSSDPRQKDIEEGVSPIQISLDQAAHLMDAVALGSVEGGWEAVRGDIATKYRDGGYPEIAHFIETAK